MTAEPQGKESTKADLEALEWLDGLAGRGGDGVAAREGQSMRSALDQAVAESKGHALPWQEIQRRAAARQGRAANAAWRRLNVAAMALICLVGSAALLQGEFSAGEDISPEQPDLRGGDSPEFRWYVDQPTAAAERLAAALKSVGAQVRLEPHSIGATLHVHCAEADCASKANQQLQSIKAGLDASGSARLDVLPTRQ
jgi:hypothetical protein